MLPRSHRRQITTRVLQDRHPYRRLVSTGPRVEVLAVCLGLRHPRPWTRSALSLRVQGGRRYCARPPTSKPPLLPTKLAGQKLGIKRYSPFRRAIRSPMTTTPRDVSGARLRWFGQSKEHRGDAPLLFGTRNDGVRGCPRLRLLRRARVRWAQPACRHHQSWHACYGARTMA